jgi:hypothetical protein
MLQGNSAETYCATKMPGTRFCRIMVCPVRLIRFSVVDLHISSYGAGARRRLIMEGYRL